MKSITCSFLFLQLGVLMFACGLLASCSEETVAQLSQSEECVTDQDLKSISKLFAIVGNDHDICCEVNQAVAESIHKHLDEQLYFRDIYGDQSEASRSLKEGRSSKLMESIGKAVSLFEKTRSTEGFSNDIISVMMREDIELYWPYSESWNGTETPVITFAPVHGQSADDVVAYKYDESASSFSDVIINETYAMAHPVWVIRLSEIPYEERDLVPVFVPIDKEDLVVTRSGNIGHSWEMDSLRCVYQYDSWLLGGPDFRFVIAYPQQTGTVAETTEFRETFTRSQVNNREAKYFFYRPLNQDWTEYQLTNHLRLIEEDRTGGNSATLELTATRKVGDTTVSCKVTIPLSSYDTSVASEVFARSAVLSPDNPRVFWFDQNRVEMGHTMRQFSY